MAWKGQCYRKSFKHAYQALSCSQAVNRRNEIVQSEAISNSMLILDLTAINITLQLWPLDNHKVHTGCRLSRMRNLSHFTNLPHGRNTTVPTYTLQGKCKLHEDEPAKRKLSFHLTFLVPTCSSQIYFHFPL